MSRKIATNGGAQQRQPKSTRPGTEYVTISSREADAMHAELLAQCEKLMKAKGGSKAARDLDRISKLVADYEAVRWPF